MENPSDENAPIEALWALEDLRTIRREVDRFLERYADPPGGDGAADSSLLDEAAAMKREGDGGDRPDTGTRP